MDMLTLKKCMDTIYTWKKAPISKACDLSEGKKLLILANGPSAKEFWDNDDVRERFKSYDLMCMNDTLFRKSRELSLLKPKYLIVVDPANFGHRENETPEEYERNEMLANNMKNSVSQVTWKTNFITNFHGILDFNNENVNIIRLNCNTISPEKERYYKLYKRNLANPGLDTVLEYALYFAITYGYKEIALLGTEFSLFKYVTVDDNNIMHNGSKHYYKDDKNIHQSNLVTGQRYGYKGSSVAYYLHRIANCFSTFFTLNQYAKFYGCTIYNYSDDSMIDAFERRRIFSE